MTPDHARFAEWDAAYVLGALGPAERRAFEEHLEECRLCRVAVAELGPTVGLLSRVPAETARAIDRDAAGPGRGPDPGRRGDLVVLAGRRRRRRRMLWAGVVAAALVVVAVVGIPAVVGRVASTGSVHPLADLAGVPLEASVRLTDVPWGTRIDLVCQYSGDVLEAPEGGWPYALAVVGDDGATTTLSTWRAAPGSTTSLSAGTELTVGDIGAIEIRSVDGADVLMRYAAD